MRVIPAMDLLGGRVVRLHRGRYDAVTEYSRDPAAVVQGFVDAGARWLHVVDLDGAREGRAVQHALIASLLQRFGAQLSVQVGGGIRTLEQAKSYAAAGASRVVLGTRVAKDPGFVAEVLTAVPVVAAIDANEGRVATDGWTVTTELLAVDLAKDCVLRGVSAVLYTDIARDGTGEGPSVEQTATLARAVAGVEVIASGGIGALAHIEALAKRSEIASTVVGRALYEGAFTLREALAVAEGR